jgi:hypothetical protein
VKTVSFQRFFQNSENNENSELPKFKTVKTVKTVSFQRFFQNSENSELPKILPKQ